MFGRGIILILVISILLLGCTGAPGGGPSGGTAAGGEVTGGGAGATGGTGTTGGETGGTGATGGTGTSGGTGQTSGDDFAGKTYEQLMGMGVPMQCDITMTYQGQTTSMKLYMKDKDNVRNEIPLTDASVCPKMISIMKGDTVYSGCEGKKYPPGTSCDWMKFVTNNTGTTAGSTTTPDYTDVPSTQISCLPWVPDDSKFATSGKVCTQQDIMDEMMNQYNN